MTATATILFCALVPFRAAAEEAATDTSVPATTGSAAETKEPPAAERPFWISFLEDHWRHVVLALGALEIDRVVDKRMGPRDSPLFLSDPPSFDREVQERFGSNRSSTGGFVQAHATPLTSGIATAIIFASNGSRWRDDMTDLVGWWEAERFNVAMTGLVKNAVGRERPKLELAEEQDPNSAETMRLDRRPDQHKSFYSFHASSAFTTVSYADLVLSRRLVSHPAVRRWARGGLYALAGFISWQRIEQNGHYLSDVATGALAGIYTGRSFYSFNHPDGTDRWLSWDPRPRRHLSLSPPLVLRDGLYLSARIGF